MRCFTFLLAIVAWFGSPLWARNLEAGVQAGLSTIRNTVPPYTERDASFGVIILLWPHAQWAVSADWMYIGREEFFLPEIPFGEENRNRQYVDLTLQHHFLQGARTSLYGEIGGGALYDNRDVINIHQLPQFQRHGHKSTRRGIWTVGFGARTQLRPHLNWFGGIKAHNLVRRDDGGLRLVTGLVLSWR